MRLFSLGVIVGALLITFFGWRFIDPLISMVICIFIAREIYKIIRQTVNSLLDAVPADIDFNARQKRSCYSIAGVAEVNDLHIWQTGADQKLLSAHLKSEEDSPDHEAIIRAIQEILHAQVWNQPHNDPDSAIFGRRDGALQPLQLITIKGREIEN